MRPSRVWKEMRANERVRAADAFWRDEESPDIAMQQMEALVAIAKRLNFRPKSVQALPVERRALALARIGDLSDGVATRILISHHFRNRRGLMGAFLDALGIAHENGLIAGEEGTAPPDRDRLANAIEAVRAVYPPDEVTLYLRTLTALDEDTWVNLEGLVPVSG